MRSTTLFAALLAILLLGPFLLRKTNTPASTSVSPDETLVIITPHNEATRYEFARAFAAAHFAKTGRHVQIDWRTVGGTSEITRYVAAQYLGSFRDYWTHTLGKQWSPACTSFDDPKASGTAAVTSASSPPIGDAPASRKAFLNSNVGCGIDLFFGGGSFDFIQMAAAGRLIDSGVIAAHPQLFSTAPGGTPTSATQIPALLRGEPLWDAKSHLWIGACLGAFGICYNTDSITRLALPAAPAQWSDLANPLYANQLALADPTQSGSVAKAFEMILQQQIALSGSNPALGWERGMNLIQRISANARSFTDSASEIPYSVQAGDAAAGMCIDFYGRFESDAVRPANGPIEKSRLQYITPAQGSSTGADPIGMFRGAPHGALAREFIDFVISQPGQQLWSFRAGAPGGPEKYTLRRLPIRPDLYAAPFRDSEPDAAVNPFTDPTAITYQPRWTASLFNVISFTIHTAFIDPHDELKQAWQALADANFPPEATRQFADLTAISYATASTQISAALKSPNKLDKITLERTLDQHFRQQYRHVTELARQARGVAATSSP